MSTQAVSYVLARAAPDGLAERLVLIVLAHHAGRDPVPGSDGRLAWEAWPSLALIGREAGIAQRKTVRRAVRRLEKAGALETVPGGGRHVTNRYRIPLETGARATPLRARDKGARATPLSGTETGARGAADPTETGARRAPKRGHVVPPEQSMNNLVDLARVTRQRDDDEERAARARHPSAPRTAWGDHYPDAITRARAALHGGEKTRPTDDDDDDQGEPFP